MALFKELVDSWLKDDFKTPSSRDILQSESINEDYPETFIACSRTVRNYVGKRESNMTALKTKQDIIALSDE